MELSAEQIAEIKLLLTSDEISTGGRWRCIEIEPSHYYSCCENLNVVIHHSYYDTRGQRRKARLMTLRPDFDGYLICSFKTKAIRFHRLKAKIFLDNYDENLEVNHKDCNKQNNKVSNLEMVTHKENIHHFYTDPQVSEHRDACRQRKHEFTQSEKWRLQQQERIKRNRDPDVRLRRSQSMKSYYQDLTNRQKTSDAMKRACQSEDRRKRMSDAAKLKWQDPEFRARMISSRIQPKGR